ncbi:unnamed protein product, partial [marine sediment metagenome]
MSLNAEIFEAASECMQIDDLDNCIFKYASRLGVDHMSYWGIDKERKRVFFVRDLSKKLPIESAQLRVIPFGHGFLGEAALNSPAEIVFLNGPEEIAKSAFIAKEFLSQQGLNQVIAVPIRKRHYLSYFLVAFKEQRTISDELHRDFRHLLSIYTPRYSNLRNWQYRRLLIALAQNSLQVESNIFFKEIDDSVRSYFGADSFSVWKKDSKNQNKLINCFMSKKVPSKMDFYLVGEGATGSCFDECKAFLAHRMEDLIDIEGINW